jgi:hypothetical protein
MRGSAARRVLRYLIDRLVWSAFVGAMVLFAMSSVRPAVADPPLSTTSTVTVRYIDAAGTEVLRPDAMPLWRYVESSGGKADIVDLKTRIDRAAKEKRDLAVVLHEYADGRPYGSFGR